MKEVYTTILQDGITIYLHSEVKYIKPRLCIGLRSYLFIRDVYAYDPETKCFCSGGQKDDESG